MLKLKPEELKRLIIENNFASDKKVDEALKKSESEKKSLQDFLIDNKIISEKELVTLYGQANNIPFIDLSTVEIKKEHLSQLPEKISRRYQAVVFGEEEDGSLKLAMADPLDIQAVQFIEKELGYQTKLYISTSSDILNSLDLYKEGLSNEISKVIAESEEISIEENELKENASAENVQEIVQEAPISKALNIILEYAIKSRASDIHLEPREAFIQVRFRIDGVLQDTMTLPKNVLSAIVTRIKILSNLRIDEHRVPQDGRIKIKVGPKVISIRVSTLPVVDGEKVVMRLLDESNKAPTLEELGFSGTALLGIKRALTKPHGMLLVTGPTGSGKSTTLYSALSMLNSIEVNISTVEDPIEYRMPGVNQTQVNTKTGMTFASGLRALLRQDPDIIMVGEIRDTETAEMAVHAALTGHTVLSTLHTNNAAGCLPRLLDMEVEPFLISSTVNAVIGQRLVRRLCNECKEAYVVPTEQIEEIIKTFALDRKFLTTNPSKEVFAAVEKATESKTISEKIIDAPKGLENKGSILDRIASDPSILKRSLQEAEESEAKTLREAIFISQTDGNKNPKTKNSLSLTLFRAKGCPKCQNSGYNGRVGIYEVLEMTEKIGEMIVQRATSDSIEREAIENGMVTMAQDGFIKSLIGVTTIEEILRVTRE
ncbi:MAG: ATPase, T2SS/T4P/T4SS family [Patescibacteria group bacterium]|nr:ATPase, T2SS/T4P/T4SS family [Patescibacteria group bacterium]